MSSSAPGGPWAGLPRAFRVRDLAVILLLLGLVLALPRGASAEGRAMELLTRMVEATRTRNYDGIFVYRHDGQMDTMRLIHRAGPEHEAERLLSLNGEAREVLRDNSGVRCIMPDHRWVVGRQGARPGFGGGFMPDFDRLDKLYSLALLGDERIAGRTAHKVAIKSGDEFRYGYHLWLDRDSGLMLRSEVLDSESRVLEELQYTQISLPERIPDELLEPANAAQGFRRIMGGAGSEASTEVNSIWQPLWRPQGFESPGRVVRQQSDAGPVEKWLFSDGLASFSVYIEATSEDEPPFNGGSSVGSLNTFSRAVDGYQITVVGEVPMQTVRKVGEGVQRP